jgi:hypothetical protein
MYRFSCHEPDQHGCRCFRKYWSFAEFCASRHYEWESPVLRWNEISRHHCEWVWAHPQRGIIVRSEDLLGLPEQESQFSRVGTFFGWPRRRPGPIQTFQKRVRHAGPSFGAAMDWDYGKSWEFLGAYDRDTLEQVREQLDQEIASALAYPTYTRA